MKKILLYFIILCPITSFAQFKHQEAEVGFLGLLQKIKAKLPSRLKGYQSATLINASIEASANFERQVQLDVDLEAKTLLLNIVDPPKKEGAQRKTGTLKVRVYLEEGKVWIEQSFPNDRVGNWKLPVNLVGDTLQAPASEFRYLDMSPAATAKRKDDLTYNLKKRTTEAGFSETAATQYNFIFGLDLNNSGLYMDQEVLGVSTGEKDESGKDALKNIRVRVLVTEKPIAAVEN